MASRSEEVDSFLRMCRRSEEEALHFAADEIERLRALIPPPGTYRVTVHDDGTIELVAMESANLTLRGIRLSLAPFWVDVPTEPERPEDGAR